MVYIRFSLHQRFSSLFFFFHSLIQLDQRFVPSGCFDWIRCSLWCCTTCTKGQGLSWNGFMGSSAYFYSVYCLWRYLWPVVPGKLSVLGPQQRATGLNYMLWSLAKQHSLILLTFGRFRPCVCIRLHIRWHPFQSGSVFTECTFYFRVRYAFNKTPIRNS